MQKAEAVNPLDKDLELFNDKGVFQAVKQELIRQQNQIELIASENITSREVMMAQGSIMTNKYAEGYPGRRYYNGCEYVDKVEILAINRLKKLFEVEYANVQPHSGAQANEAVFLALLNPGDTILGMSMDAGGHLTHGSKVSMSGKWFNAVAYGLNPDSHLIDYNQVQRLAQEHKPKVIIAGASAYPRIIDFAKFRAIADSVGAILMADVAHYSGLIAGKAYPSPAHHAHIITSTTHKTLRGPRGGVIMTNDEALAKKINSAVFPGLQGGPLMHVIAAKAVAFGEALEPDFAKYAQQVVDNARVLAATLMSEGFNLVTGGTDCHMMMMDLRNWEMNGHEACLKLEEAGLTCNKNGVPNDPLPPSITSGLRIGTAAGTTRGFKENEFQKVGIFISRVLKAFKTGDHEAVIPMVRADVEELCAQFPIYPGLKVV